VLNLASRLCDTAEVGQIMLAKRVYADVEDLAEVEPVGDLELKGFAKPVPILNLLALKEGAT
jgi:class 3 adenylate cyclase